MSEHDWTDAKIADLRKLWGEGHATAEIGRRIGFSKNAVVGKAHRLDLPARPSPIRVAGSGRPAQPPKPRAPAMTLPPLASITLAPRAPELVRHPTAVPNPDRIALGGKGERIIPPQITSPSQPAWIVRPSTLDCCWPIGEPGTPGFKFCDAKAIMGRPYCIPHCQIAYVPVERGPKAERQAHLIGGAA